MDIEITFIIIALVLFILFANHFTKIKLKSHTIAEGDRSGYFLIVHHAEINFLQLFQKLAQE